MTLLVAVYAAIISTFLWYKYDSKNSMKIGSLSLMYWGASLMWFVDAIYEYMELNADYFVQAPTDMLNDFFLGISVVALGLMIWIGMLLINDPRGVVKSYLLKENK